MPSQAASILIDSMPFRFQLDRPHQTEQMAQPPSDEYGPDGDCPNLKPLGLSLKRRIPHCPSGELAFTARERKLETFSFLALGDRIGSMRESFENPSTTMVLSNAWGDKDDDNESRTQNRLKEMNLGEQTKRSRMKGDGDATSVDVKMDDISSVYTDALEGTPSS